ncbi:MAG: tripartite tricarboxylate transporter substrate-binding protein, partial [Acidobacteriota bacterium]
MKHQPFMALAARLFGAVSDLTSFSALAQTIRRCLTACFAVAALGVQAQPLDTPLHIVVGYAPGGGSDRIARIVADKLQAKLGSPVIVENKTGAGGRIAAQQVKTTPPGQNVLMLG